jgi:DNA polymerase-4
MFTRIAHIDMDAFFVAIERRDNPALRGLPVVVGGTSGRGVVCSCSYEARAFGIHSGMPSARARQLCPQLVCVPTRHGVYGEASDAVREVLGHYSPEVDFTSVDEGYIDLTGTFRLLGRPLDIAERIRAEVLAATGCSASLGIAGTRLCAKVASKFAKPAGIIEVAPGREAEFLAPLPAELLPGAGGKTGERLVLFGVTRIGQLREVGEHFLRRSFGAAGADLYLKACGGSTSNCNGFAHRDRDLPRKSVSHERTFNEDSTDFAFLERVLFRLSERVCRTLRDEKLVARTVTLKVRLADFRTFTRSHTMLAASDSDAEVFREVRSMLQEFDLPRVAVRLVGITLSTLSAECQWGLFSNAARFWRLYRGIDRIRDSYGFDAVVSGLVLGDETTARYQRQSMNPFLGPKYRPHEEPEPPKPAADHYLSW